MPAHARASALEPETPVLECEETSSGDEWAADSANERSESVTSYERAEVERRIICSRKRTHSWRFRVQCL